MVIASRKKTKKPTGLSLKHFGAASINDLLSMAMNIHGYPGSGKTWLALSLSKYWPKCRADGFIIIPKKKVMLEDTIYIGHDKVGLAGALKANLFPKYCVDFRSIMAKSQDLIEAIGHVSEEYREIIDKDTNISVAIHDTISRFDDFVVDHHFDPDFAVYSGYGESEKIDRWGCWGEVARTHSWYLVKTSTVPEGVACLYLFHQKVLTEPTGSQKAKDTAMEKQLIIKMGDRLVNIVPAVSGKAIGAYTADCSIEMVVAKKGKKRLLYLEVVDKMRTKNRFQHEITEPQPAHLGKLMERLGVKSR